MFAEKIRRLKMVTEYEDGRIVENDNEGDMFLWFSKHVQTHIHAEAVFGGIPTVMIDGSKVSFVEK